MDDKFQAKDMTVTIDSFERESRSKPATLYISGTIGDVTVSGDICLDAVEEARFKDFLGDLLETARHFANRS